VNNRNIIEAFLVGILLAASTATGKAFLDIEVLKTNRANDKEILLDMRKDIKFLVHKHTK